MQDFFFPLGLAGAGNPNLSHVLKTSDTPLVQNDSHLSDPVPDLAGIELTSFIAAYVVLCFAFVAKTVLITHQCYHHQVILSYLLLPKESRLGVIQMLGEDIAGTADLN